ncbi:MAG: DUF885 domain-containing protein, partial [Allopontixanthobacter sediminis]
MTFLKTHSFTRRQTLAGLGAGVSIAALPGCVTTARQTASSMPGSLSGADLLDNIAYNLLAHEPERATSLGVDVGQYAPLRSQMEDQSPAGQNAYAATLRADLARVRAADTSALDPATRTSFEVVESAYATALDGFALPYGDVAVGSWRNSPYVVIQNVGSYIDLPRFFDSTQPLNNAGDAEAYLSRLSQVPTVLNGELERMRAATDMGVVPPDFLLVKAVAQMKTTLADAMEGGSLVAPLAASQFGKARADEAAAIVKTAIAPALEAQLAELYRQQKLATPAPGISARPRGEEYYAWALRASTTTNLTPDEVHQRGLDELASLHGRMDPILRELGYTSGTVGARMNQLGSDPRF